MLGVSHRVNLSVGGSWALRLLSRAQFLIVCVGFPGRVFIGWRTSMRHCPSVPLYHRAEHFNARLRIWEAGCHLEGMCIWVRRTSCSDEDFPRKQNQWDRSSPIMTQTYHSKRRSISHARQHNLHHISELSAPEDACTSLHRNRIWFTKSESRFLPRRFITLVL